MSETIMRQIVALRNISRLTHASGGEPDRIERLKSKIPMQRGGLPKEVAEAIFWLATDRSSFTTVSFIGCYWWAVKL